MAPIRIGGSAMRECEKCGGLWLEVAAFARICADREQQAAVLGLASPVTSNKPDDETKVRYVPCPECGQLMNRMNFARCSGVIVDVCRNHGTWFDRDELRVIIEFIREGGLDLSRQKEKRELAYAQEKFRLDQMMAGDRITFNDDERLSGIVASGNLLEFILKG
jgi:Zn-finger nucleic acid-binding protein